MMRLSLAEDLVVTTSWDAEIGAVLLYEVQRTQVKISDNAADCPSILPDSMATSMEDSSVSRGETYYDRVRVVDGQFRERTWTTSVGVTVSE